MHKSGYLPEIPVNRRPRCIEVSRKDCQPNATRVKEIPRKRGKIMCLLMQEKVLSIDPVYESPSDD